MTIELRADAADAGAPLNHFWSTCTGAGRANEGLRAAWQEHLRMVVDACGFRYVRFHGIFHDDMFVYRQGAYGPVYNFQYINELFDRLLDAGIRPFVELAFMPGDLAREKSAVFWWGARGSPPVDLGAWAELVRRTVKNWIDRYGVKEVRRWYFEVWNEPNLWSFFRGTRSEYFELYKVTVRAVKDVDPLLRVGGPGTSNFVPDKRFAGEVEDKTAHAVVTEAEDLDALDWRPVWLEAFLDYCDQEGLPVDFVSCHPYPTDWALDGQGIGDNYTRGSDSTPRDLALLREIVGKSRYPQAEIHITEWNSTPSPRDHTHDHPQAATFIVKSNVESIGLVDSLTYWTFTDVFEEGGAGDTAFHGGFGLINFQGIPKPSFHAYRFLNALGDELISRGPAVVVTRHAASGKLTALAYHYPPEMPLSVPLSRDDRAIAEQTLALGKPETLEIELTGLAPDSSVMVQTVASGSGDAVAAWIELGSPEPLSRADIAELRRRAAQTNEVTLRADDRGMLRHSLSMPPWAIVLVRQR